MPNVIRVLDETLINQIAAGEVIEQPASVIKEMVENSLDAGATSIFIEIQGGGRQLIRITDNGSGMGEEDALLAFRRHATSKIISMDDFETLRSMGFRGEALASVASIAKVSMKTRPKGATLGTLVQIEGGALRGTSSIPSDFGTSIEVADLFFNVPARKKFLKSPAQDQQEIQKGVIQLALANQGVHFQLIADQKLVMDAPAASTQLERASQLLHSEMIEQMQGLDHAEGGFRIEGLIGSPSQHRPNKTGQWLFINQRAISSWLISQAVLDGYSTLLPERRFPIFVLHLTIPPSLVDVNVHPQKKEVRFRNDCLLREFIQTGIAKQWEAKPRSQPIFVEKEKAPPAPVWSMPQPLERKTFTPPILEVQEPVEASFFESKVEAPLPHVLGACSSYIFLDTHPLGLKEGAGFCLLDCKRARARIIYEQALEGLKGRRKERQSLLIPMTFDLNGEEILRLPILDGLGFTVRQMGNGSCAIEAIPLFLKDHEIQETVKALLREDQTGDFAARLALKAASGLQEKGPRIDPDQAKLLMKTLLACQQPYFSPKGEPVFAWVPESELTRYFK
jgi:DNA mismatch repair protein MutL